MIVSVLFFGIFRQLADCREIIVTLNEGALLADLIEYLVTKYGQNFKNEITGSPQLNILINGQYHNTLDNSKQNLKMVTPLLFYRWQAVVKHNYFLKI